MPYNSETETFYQAPATVVDSTPDGDTVQEGFDDRLTPAMAGLYADLNLLKADGMISVGIPATTTTRGIGRVATSADLVDGATITNGPAFLAAGQDVAQAAANFWVGARYAECSTSAATSAKAADLANFQLVKGSRVFVTFTNANTVADALTLNVNGTGAKTVYNEHGATSSSNIATWLTGVPIEFVYDGTYWRYKTVDAVGNAICFYLYARDEKPSGIAGGATTALAWLTRDINTIKVNRIGASIASNRITLPAGKYYIRANAPSLSANNVRAAIYDYTHTSYVSYGPVAWSSSADNTEVTAFVEDEITLSETTQIELRMFATSTYPSGCGFASSVPGVIEIYSEIRIWKM